jgi:hypothetical protein
MYLMLLQVCQDADVAASQHVYPASGSAQPFQWPLNSPLEQKTGSGGSKVLTYTFSEDLVISLPKAPCFFVDIDSEVQATGENLPDQESLYLLSAGQPSHLPI